MCLPFADTPGAAAVHVLLREDLCEALFQALVAPALPGPGPRPPPALATAALLVCAVPQGSPFLAVAARGGSALVSPSADPTDLCRPAPCAVGSSSRSVDVACSHGLCRGQPPRLRPGVAALLEAAAAACPQTVEAAARTLYAQCRDACGRPSLEAWRLAASAGSPTAQMTYALTRYRAPGHQAAAEAFATFAALAASSEADAKGRAKAHLHLGLGYMDGVGTAASDTLAEEHLARAVELGMCVSCPDVESQRLVEDASDLLTSLRRSTFFANGR